MSSQLHPTSNPTPAAPNDSQAISAPYPRPLTPTFSLSLPTDNSAWRDQISHHALHTPTQAADRSGALNTESVSSMTNNSVAPVDHSFYQQLCYMANRSGESAALDDNAFNNNNETKMDFKIADEPQETASLPSTFNSAVSPLSAGIEVPRPEKPSAGFGALEECGGASLNEDETAHLLLRFSQNLSRPATASSAATNSPARTPCSPAKGAASHKARTFFRPPGLEAPTAAESAETGVLVCPVCGFSCTSRFHYNSHMNTHGCHRCAVPSCNYTSRTEGRLKKHMMDSHTADQRRDVGYVVGAAASNGNGEPRPAEEEADGRLPHVLEQMKALTEQTAAFGQPGSSARPENATPAPKRGKPKRYPCKQCDYVSTDKETRYRHAKTHIPQDKQLTCPHCEFVTEYKHHLQYHMRNHFGSKPFKCTKCEYACVNKSMLNSHMKSHTPVYQYKCQDCTYQTKYCHSLKMHLYKYNHRRAPGSGVEGDELEADERFDGLETESMKNYDMPEQVPEPQTPTPAVQFAQSVPQPVTSLGNVLLHHPVLGQPDANPLQLAQQFLLHPQRIQELMRAAAMNNLLQRLKCDHCEFTTLSREELLRHHLHHLVYNQKAPPPNNIGFYQNMLPSLPHLALPHRPIPTQPLSGADLLRNSMQLANPKPAALPASMEQAAGAERACKAEVMDVNVDVQTTTSASHASSSPPRLDTYHEESHVETSPSADCSVSPSDSHKSLDNASSGGSPHSSTTTTHSGRKQSKGSKLDKISQRLQGKCTPDTVADDRTSSPERNDTEPPSPYKQEPIDVQGEHMSFSSLLTHLNNATGVPRTMPYTCQFCVLGFQDRALFQIHLGYHGYDAPFKCNRCGHQANSSLEFNLHLYQAKH